MKGDKRNRKGFRFYLVNTRTGKIKSGHEGSVDAEKARLATGSFAIWHKVRPAALMERLKIDPDKDDNWEIE